MIKQNQTKTDPQTQRMSWWFPKKSGVGGGWEYNLKKLKRHKKINTK